jgi:hypothetical protein
MSIHLWADIERKIEIHVDESSDILGPFDVTAHPID